MRSKQLSEQQLQDFARDGFLFLRKPFDPAEAGRIVSWVDEVQAYPEVPGKYMMYFEKSLLDPEKRILQRMENVYDHLRGIQGTV